MPYLYAIPRARFFASCHSSAITYFMLHVCLLPRALFVASAHSSASPGCERANVGSRAEKCEERKKGGGRVVSKRTPSRERHRERETERERHRERQRVRSRKRESERVSEEERWRMKESRSETSHTVSTSSPPSPTHTCSSCTRACRVPTSRLKSSSCVSEMGKGPAGARALLAAALLRSPAPVGWCRSSVLQ